jgi:hypothetical protein
MRSTFARGLRTNETSPARGRREEVSGGRSKKVRGVSSRIETTGHGRETPRKHRPPFRKGETEAAITMRESTETTTR